MLKNSQQSVKNGIGNGFAENGNGHDACNGAAYADFDDVYDEDNDETASIFNDDATAANEDDSNSCTEVDAATINPADFDEAKESDDNDSESACDSLYSGKFSPLFFPSSKIQINNEKKTQNNFCCLK